MEEEKNDDFFTDCKYTPFINHVEEAFVDEKILGTPELGNDDDWNEHFLLLKQKLHFSTSYYHYGLSFLWKNMEDPGLDAHTDCTNTNKVSRIILGETMWTTH